MNKLKECAVPFARRADAGQAGERSSIVKIEKHAKYSKLEQNMVGILSKTKLDSKKIRLWYVSGDFLDLIWRARGHWRGAEVKYADVPTRTKSMINGLNDVKLKHLWVIYSGKKEYPFASNISVLPISFIDRRIRKTIIH